MCSSDLIANIVKAVSGGKIDLTKPGVIPKVPYPKLADGGVVSPTKGGSIVQVAEAGRPERIEPLDPSGLSKRDRAMIQLLANQASAGNMTINVYPSEGMNETELAAKVSRQIALQMRRGNVR